MKNSPQTITALLAEWKRLDGIANRMGFDASEARLGDEAVEQMSIAKMSMLALPSLTLHDLAAKIVVDTDNGASVLDKKIIEEARSILSADPPAKMVPASANFEIVCAMEEPMTVIEDMLNAFGVICQVPDLTVDNKDSAVIQRLSWIAKDHLKTLEKLRGDLWDINHAGSGRFQNGEQL